ISSDLGIEPTRIGDRIIPTDAYNGMIIALSKTGVTPTQRGVEFPPGSVEGQGSAPRSLISSLRCECFILFASHQEFAKREWSSYPDLMKRSASPWRKTVAVELRLRHPHRKATGWYYYHPGAFDTVTEFRDCRMTALRVQSMTHIFGISTVRK